MLGPVLFDHAVHVIEKYFLNCMNNAFNMKQFLAFAILVLIISTAKAQKDQQLRQKNLDLMKKLLNQNYELHKNLEGTPNPKDYAFDNELKSKFLFETEKGNVYESALDNMRWLKPTFHSTMPVDRKSPEIYIPNTLHNRQ